MHKDCMVNIAKGTINALICVFGIFFLAAGFIDDTAWSQTGSSEHFVIEEVLNTKLATMQGQLNRAFEQQRDIINRIGGYLEELQKQGKLPKTDEVLKDASK